MPAFDPQVTTDSGYCRKVAAVSPSDSTDLPGGPCRALLVGTSGLAKITDASGNTTASVPLQAGYNPIGCQRVWSTGTAASGIFALY